VKHSDPYINALLTNDQRGVQDIYNTYLPRIEAIIAKMGGSKDEAWEVFQESLIVILNKAQQSDFQLSSSFYTFLVSIAKFKWFNESKKKHKKNVTIDEIGTLSDEEDIMESLLKLERFQLYKKKLSELDPTCQKLFESFFNKVPLRKIAEELGLTTENAAKQKKYKCQKKLIENIKKDVTFKQLL